jgi:hypothetical protein
MESAQQNKPFVFTTKRVNDENPVVLTYYPEDSEPYEVLLKFRWFFDFLGPNGIQPKNAIYDFGDPWSKYHLANIAWAKANNIFTLTGAGCNLITFDTEEPVIQLGCEVFEDGDVTTFTTTVETPEGETLTNSITLSLTINTSIA